MSVNNAINNSIYGMTNGQLLIGSTGAAASKASLTAGAGISITPGAGSITIANSGAVFAWTVITAATQTISVSNGYASNRSAGVAFTLPATAAVGDTFSITNIHASGGWSIAQGSGQVIQLGNVATTSGAGGSLASTATGDTVTIICTVADTNFQAISYVGNITVV